MQDVIFDIDGTLADASHRLHFIVPPDNLGGWEFRKDWDSFLSDEEVSRDTPIEPVWLALLAMLDARAQIIFITGRPEKQRVTTWNWLRNRDCILRNAAHLKWACWHAPSPALYMRTDGDHRPSHIVKRELLQLAREDGFDPKLAFEDREKDTRMWREEGLICAQVADGNY